MSTAYLIPVIVAAWLCFAICIVAQLWIVERVKRRLIRDHPEAWLKASAAMPWWEQNPGFRFVRKRMDRGLNDDRLTRLVGWQRRIWWFSLVPWLAFLVSIFLISSGQSPPR